MAEIGSVIDGKYEIKKQIGKGGMSAVYLAADRRLKKLWAIKEVEKNGDGKNEEVIVNSLMTEADIMKCLDHPALPRIVDIMEDPDHIYVAMDYIEGKSLDRILAQNGPQPEELVIDWAGQICDALSYLHSRKPPIIYRDMKPANVILRPEGNIKIIDFGIAREYREKGRSDTTILGTRGYASPEHYGSRQTDARSDIYTLGMTMHHLLTGVSPRTPGYEYHPVRYWNPNLSAGIETVVDKCTALDPEARYPNCKELMYDLEHIPLLSENIKEKQKRRIRIFLFTSVLAAALFSTGLFLRVREESVSRDYYDGLVSVISSLSPEERMENYTKAVRLRPDDTTAYLCMLDVLEEEGSFNRAQSDAFLSLYNDNRGALDETSVETADLNYRIGTLYFNYYGGDGSFSARVQKAYPFFAAIHDRRELLEDYADRDIAECYYQICSFYKTFILSPLNEREVCREDYQRLLSSMDECVGLALEASEYDQLMLYNSVFLLLYDQRERMAAAHMDEETVLNLLDRVRSRTVVLSVQKEQSLLLQKEILDHYKEYREAVTRAYVYAKEDSHG